MAETRKGILARFRKKIAGGAPLIGGGAGTGISAKFEEAGGIDLIVIYNSGRFRMAGHGSLAGLLPFGVHDGSDLLEWEAVAVNLDQTRIETDLFWGAVEVFSQRRRDGLAQDARGVPNGVTADIGLA